MSRNKYLAGKPKSFTCVYREHPVQTVHVRGIIYTFELQFFKQNVARRRTWLHKNPDEDKKSDSAMTLEFYHDSRGMGSLKYVPGKDFRHPRAGSRQN